MKNTTIGNPVNTTSNWKEVTTNPGSPKEAEIIRLIKPPIAPASNPESCEIPVSAARPPKNMKYLKVLGRDENQLTPPSIRLPNAPRVSTANQITRHA